MAWLRMEVSYQADPEMVDPRWQYQTTEAIEVEDREDDRMVR